MAAAHLVLTSAFGASSAVGEGKQNIHPQATRRGGSAGRGKLHSSLGQQVMSEPGYCAQFYPSANCQNKGAGNPIPIPTTGGTAA
jgi:hypothetical protein